MITLTFLAEWAIRSSILILCGALLLEALRVKDASVHLAAWTTMLCVSLALPALTSVLPAIPLPLLPAASAPREISALTGGGASPSHRAVPLPDTGKRTQVSKPFDWGRAAVAFYLSVAGALLLRLFTGLAMSLRLLRGSRATGLAAEGIEIRESNCVVSPLALGIVRASIVLPVDWREWSSAKLDAVVAHERSHIGRWDPAVQLLSRVHRALLWFSPLAWFMHTRIVRLAEEASDDAAVAATGDRASYAEVLLDFMQRGVRAERWQGIAMARYVGPEERIHRILDAPALSRGITRWTVLAILALGSPLAYVAAAARPQQSSQAQQASGAEPWVAEIQSLLKKGEIDAAGAKADEHLKEDPNSGVAQLLKAAALLRQGKHDEARAVLEKLLDEHPDKSDVLLELGVLNLMQKRFAEADAAFSKAYTVDPSNLRGLLGVSEVHFQQGEPDEGVEVIADELTKNPSRADIQKELANAEFRAKQYDKALADFQAILDRYKDTPNDEAEIYKDIGVTYQVLGDVQKAVEYLQKAVQLAPSNMGYLSALAQNYDIAGKLQEAISTYRAALKIEPGNPVVSNNLAYLIAESADGDLDEALSLAERAQEKLPNMAEVLDTIGWVYLKKNQTAEAVEFFRRLVDKSPDNPTFHHHYAIALSNDGDTAGALQELNKALQCHPNENEENQIKDMIHGLSP